MLKNAAGIWERKPDKNAAFPSPTAMFFSLLGGKNVSFPSEASSGMLYFCPAFVCLKAILEFIRKKVFKCLSVM
jgi:hypothetical protein